MWRMVMNVKIPLAKLEKNINLISFEMNIVLTRLVSKA